MKQFQFRRKNVSLVLITLNKLSSNNKAGPVGPMIIVGCPANKAKKMPPTELSRSVSVTPIILDVLAPVKRRNRSFSGKETYPSK